MMRYLIFLSMACMFASCATLFNDRTMNVDVRSASDSVQICNGSDTTKWYPTPASLTVKRSAKDLNIIAKKDSIRKQIDVESKLSIQFLAGNFLTGAGCILGYPIDLTNSKRYTYPREIVIDFDANTYSTPKMQPEITPRKGIMAWHLFIPVKSLMYLNKGNGYGNSTGSGLSAGVEYYFSDKNCVNLNLGLSSDRPMEYADDYKCAKAYYGAIQLGSDYKRLHYDWGLQYTATEHRRWKVIETLPENMDTLYSYKGQNNFGFAFSANYNLFSKVNVGVNYDPSFLIWGKSGFKMHYSHVLSFNLGLRMQSLLFRKRD